MTADQGVCLSAGCARQVRSRGMCSTHYKYWHRSATPDQITGRWSGTRDERFWSKVAKSGPTDCWKWLAGRTNNGYGVFFWGATPTSKREQRLAHRAAYELLIGPIPAGLELDHLCRVRDCVNPAHLEPVTHTVNSLRGVGVCAKNLAKTHCPHGHPYTVENTIVRASRARVCRTCNIARLRRRRGAAA